MKPINSKLTPNLNTVLNKKECKLKLELSSRQILIMVCQMLPGKIGGK
jgi:hypothetical protein